MGGGGVKTETKNGGRGWVGRQCRKGVVWVYKTGQREREREREREAG